MPTRNKQQNRPRFLDDVVYVTRDTGNGAGVLNDVVVTPYSEGNYDPDNYKEELAAERARHAELARQYLAQNPTLTNRIKYNYHKYKSTPFGTRVWDVMGKYAPQRGLPPDVGLKGTNALNVASRLHNIKTIANALPYIIQRYPGYQLRLLMAGNPLEKQISKIGMIDANNIVNYATKGSNVEKTVINDILNSKQFAGKKYIDYNDFRKAVRDRLITYNRVPQTEYADYGIDGLGFNVEQTKNRVEQVGIGDDPFGIPVEPVTIPPSVKLNTFTFESPRISLGSAKHYDASTLGHSRTYTTTDEPNILHVMESQSDWGQEKFRNYAGRNYLTQQEKDAHFINTMRRIFGKKHPEDVEKYIRLYSVGGHDVAAQGQYSKSFIEDASKYSDLDKVNPKAIYRLSKYNATRDIEQNKYLHDNYFRRQIQENLKYAAEHNQSKMRYPTPETVVKIEGYQKSPWAIDESGRPMNPNDFWDFDKATFNFPEGRGGFDYVPEHKTVLNRYSTFPKVYKKLYNNADIRTVTDSNGNSWYEVDVPKNYLQQEWLFKRGGKIFLR